MKRVRGSRATSAANGGLTAIIASSVPVNSHDRLRDAAGDAGFVADRPDDVVGGEDREQVQPRPGDQAAFTGAQVDQPAQERAGRAAGLLMVVGFGHRWNRLFL